MPGGGQGQRGCLAAGHWDPAALPACRAAPAEPPGLFVTPSGRWAGLGLGRFVPSEGL